MYAYVCHDLYIAVLCHHTHAAHTKHTLSRRRVVVVVVRHCAAAAAAPSHHCFIPAYSVATNLKKKIAEKGAHMHACFIVNIVLCGGNKLYAVVCVSDVLSSIIFVVLRLSLT